MTQEYKGYNIVSTPVYTMKSIKPIGKGSVHKELTGLYTSASEAEKAIDRFLVEKEKAGAKTKKSG